MGHRVEEWLRFARGVPPYPPRLERLGEEAPAELTVSGDPRLLIDPPVALFCSVAPPAGGVLDALDLARGLREAGVPVVGGFQSPVERECLALLARGDAPLTVCPARGLEGMRLPPVLQARWRSGLLLLSRFDARLRRPTAAMAEVRNRMVAALAGSVVVVHATPGGRLMRVAALALGWGVPVYCLDRPENRDLVVLGALPGGAAELVRALTPAAPAGR